MSDSDKIRMVEVFAGSAWEAALVKSLMDNAEIPAFLKDEIRGTTMPWQVEPGGFFAVKVMVLEDNVQVAREVVADFEANRKRDEA
jgi:hypothetical protein